MKANRSVISRFAVAAVRPKVLRRALAAAALPLLLSSCASPTVIPAAAPPPPPRRRLPPPPPPAPADWHDNPATPGEWRWSQDGTLSVARFGSSAQGDLLSLTCNRATAKIILAREGSVGSAANVTIRTTTLSRALAGQAGASSITVGFSARDPLLDAMAFSRGRFAVEISGLPPLYLPSWPEVGRVIEDCR